MSSSPVLSIKACGTNTDSSKVGFRTQSLPLKMDLMSSVWTLMAMTDDLEEVRRLCVVDHKSATPALHTEVGNIRDSCGRQISTRTLNFPAGRHGVRGRDVNSWDRDTCVSFMCRCEVEVWYFLRFIWIYICHDRTILQMEGSLDFILSRS